MSQMFSLAFLCGYRKGSQKTEKIPVSLSPRGLLEMAKTQR